MMLWRMSESPSGLRDPASWPVAKMPPPSTISTRSARRVATSSWSWTPSPGRTFHAVQQVPRTMARGRVRCGRPFLMPPNFAPDGRDPPAETLVGTAVSRRLLARRCSRGHLDDWTARMSDETHDRTATYPALPAWSGRPLTALPASRHASGAGPWALLTACSAGHSHGHSTGHNCNQLDRTGRNLGPT
jgi:hypothetical protein